MRAREELERLAQRGPRGRRPGSQPPASAEAVLADLLEDFTHPDEAVAVPTGIAALDRMLARGGWRPGLFLIAGAPGVGKSAFALQSCLRAVGAGHAVLYVSIELSRLHLDAVGVVLAPLLLAGRVATCAVVDLELGWSARRGLEWEAIMDERRGFARVAVSAECCERALRVQGLLAARGQHRAVPIPDLLVAATAEAAGLVVLHYDAGFDLVAAVTAQEMAWVVPRGSVA